VPGVDPALRQAAGDEPQAFLRRALELTFFPELLSVRTQIGDDA